MLELIGLGATAAAALWGYVKSRRFVRGRLRFVETARSRPAPWVAGAAAAIVAAPVVWLLPLVGVPSALIFGASIGFGVAHGARDIRRLPP